MAAHAFRSSLLRGWRAHVRGEHPNLPIIALTNHRPVSLDLGRTEALAFNSRTPSSGRPHLIASRTYNVRGILIGFADMVAENALSGTGLQSVSLWPPD